MSDKPLCVKLIRMKFSCLDKRKGHFYIENYTFHAAFWLILNWFFFLLSYYLSIYSFNLLGRGGGVEREFF